MKEMKRILSFLLCFVMVLGLFPAGILTVEAAGETIYVLAGSDFQASSHDAGATIVSGLLTQIKKDYPTMNGFLFAGDYDVNYSDSANGKAKLQETVQGVYGTGMDEIYVQGNHDGDSLVGSTLTASGANDADAYGVFVINEKDYMWYNNDEATIKNTAANLETYLNAKRNAGYTKPIFVISHLPLHYSMRTREGGNDGMHANYIFNVLNEAGAAGLNIIFMFGHNHSHGWDDYLGGAAIFRTKGNKINIAQNSTTVFQEETLEFTYMNAGYVGYYGTSYTSDVDKTLTMTTFAITDTDVTISRYDSDSTHDLKSAGVYNVEYPDSAYYSTDTTTVASPYTLTLNTEITPAGTEVEAPDTGSTSTERTYTRVTSLDELVSGDQYLIIENGDTDYFMLPESISNDAGDRIGFNIESTTVAGGDTITGDYSAKEWTMTGSGSEWVLSTSAGSAYMEYQSSSRAYGRISSTNSSTFTIGGSANAYTFSATTNGYTYVFDHSSAGLINGYVKTPSTTFYIYRLTDEGSGTPSVDTSGGSWITLQEPTEADTRYVYELDTDGVDTGVEYLIVANSYEKALSAAASSNNVVDITIDGNYAYADSDTYGWTFTQQYSSYNNGVYYIRLNGSTYLRVSNGSLGSRSNTNSDARWTVSSNGDGSYDVVRSTYNLRWSNSNGVFQASSSNEGPVRLYKYVRTDTTDAQSGLYGKISGELTYNVAIGTSKEDAVAAVKAGIDVLYHNGDESAAATYPDDGDGMTWTMDESYDGTTPGEYAVTIAYNGITLGVAKVVVPSVNITGYTVEPAEGTVNKGASQAAQTGALIYVQLENGKYYTVPVTVGMLSKADGSSVSTGEMGTIENLTLTYNGEVITNSFTLNVVAKTGNNYPEYPNEGAVKVSKTGTGIDFQSSGIAQVEISASGVPMKKGADVIVMLDLSSSMSNTVSGSSQSRLAVLEASLESLLTQLQANGEDGQPMDIRIAVADFNRYYTDSSSPYYINANDHLINGSIRTNADGTNQVYTGSNDLTAGAFVDVHTLANNQFDGLGYKSGTNYDYAFDAVYQLGEAINIQNATDGVDRDLFVIFMSDGAPFQFNYFSAQSGTEGGTTDARYWNNWLTGTLTDDMKDANARNDYYNEDGKHWMAEAIKGDPASTYPVIRKNNAADTDGDTWVDVNGLGAKMYSIGFCLAVDKEITVDTMDTVIRNIASEEKYYFRADTAADLDNAFTAIGNDIAYAAYNARFVDQMGDDYDLVLGSRTYSVVDGETTTSKTQAQKIEILSYDIYTKAEADAGQIPTGKNVGDRKGTSTVIETVTFNTNGTEAYSTLNSTGPNGETITAGSNILIDGVIYANTFWYNTTATDKAITGVDIPTGVKSDGTTTGSTNVLPSETFYWKLGTVQTSELAMRYYVYLTGSMEGTREAGSYPTNEYATLYYDNYLENPCYKDTVSPVLAWKEANVSYAFYLVDENGNIIVNQTTGEIGTFANKIAVTNPVVYETIKLNNLDTVSSIEVESLGVLPDGYELYDGSAVYTIRINSNTTGSWEIVKSTDKVASTYVTQFDPDDASAYSSDLLNGVDENGNTVVTGNDYTHTVVWFAVLWKVQALPDTVVIDYGLPVDISVLTNDMFGENGKLAGVGAYSDSLNLDGHDATLASGFGISYTGTYGVAKADTTTGKVRYQVKDMQMNGYEKFAYAVNYTGATNPGYYYDTVTVIPATTIYYEDSFVTLNGYEWDYNANPATWKSNDNLWTLAGTTVDGVQDEDRPGYYSLTDANNIYGSDSAYKSMSQYSMGSARVFHANYDAYGEMVFTFYGTGFDVISMTNNKTGGITLDVYEGGPDSETYATYTNSAGESETCQFTVDTYYGYKYENGEWVITDSADPNSLYQVPVIEVEGLTYGQYTVKMKVSYVPLFDHEQYGVEANKMGAYDFYLDAIRIYDPANDGAADVPTDTTIEDAYKADGEGWPSYIELRNNLITKASLGNAETDTVITGLVFIDGDAEVDNEQISDYVSYGPNNEVYLAPGQRVAFLLNTPDNIKNVHIGIKSADGEACTYTITNIAQSTNTETGVNAGDYYGAKTATVNTTTDMYYDLTGWKGDIIVISNTGDRYGTTGIISLTNIKSTYTSDPNSLVTTGEANEETAGTFGLRSVSLETASIGVQSYGLMTASEDVAAEIETTVPETTVPQEAESERFETYVYMTPAAAALVVETLNADAEEEVPGETEPEVTEPEITDPETSEPEITEPETTEPETTVPETTEPGETEPDNGSAWDRIWDRIWDLIGKIFG